MNNPFLSITKGTNMISKSIRLAVSGISVFSLLGSVANAAVVREAAGSKSERYVRIDNRNDVIFF